MLRFDHEMGDRPSDGVNDHANYLATDPIGAGGVGSDRELRRLCHNHLPQFFGPCDSNACRINARGGVTSRPAQTQDAPGALAQTRAGRRYPSKPSASPTAPARSANRRASSSPPFSGAVMALMRMTVMAPSSPGLKVLDGVHDGLGLGALMVTVPWAAPTRRSPLVASIRTTAVRLVSEMTSERA